MASDSIQVRADLKGPASLIVFFFSIFFFILFFLSRGTVIDVIRNIYNSGDFIMKQYTLLAKWIDFFLFCLGFFVSVILQKMPANITC